MTLVSARGATNKALSKFHILAKNHRRRKKLGHGSVTVMTIMVIKKNKVNF